MKTVRSSVVCWLVGLAAACAVPTTAAQDPAAKRALDTAGDSPGIGPEAKAVLDRMTAYLGTLERFSIVASESRDQVLSFGYKLQRNQSAKMVVQRPDRLRVDVTGDIKTRTYVYDGKTLTIHAPDAGVYAQVEAPPTIRDLVNGLLNRGVEMPLIDVLLQGFQGTLTEGVRVGLLVGDSEIDGVPVQHLAFRQATIDWQLWVDKGERPLPRRFAITTRYEFGNPQYEATLAWDLKPKTDRRTFTFDPGETRRIPFSDEPAAATR